MLGGWYLECPTDMVTFKLETFLMDEGNQQVVVWEFTRGMADIDKAFQCRESLKRHTYHWVCLLLQNRLQGYVVK